METGLRKKICPFTIEPREGCLCVKTESRYAEAILNICGADYEECKIFRELTKDRKRPRTQSSHSKEEKA